MDFLHPSRTGVSRTGISRTGISRTGISRTGISRTGISRTGISSYWNFKNWNWLNQLPFGLRSFLERFSGSILEDSGPNFRLILSSMLTFGTSGSASLAMTTSDYRFDTTSYWKECGKNEVGELRSEQIATFDASARSLFQH